MLRVHAVGFFRGQIARIPATLIMKLSDSFTLAALALAKLAQATPTEKITATTPVMFAELPLLTEVRFFTELAISTGGVFTAIENGRT